MSMYLKAINALLAGETIELDGSVNLVSLRRQFHRTLEDLRSKGMHINQKLQYTTTADKTIARCVSKPSISFTVKETNDESSP